MKNVNIKFKDCFCLRAIFGLLIIFSSFQSNAQLAVNKGIKFLGSVIPASTPSTFSTYWNQVTPENAGKWGSVESVKDVMNWTQLDNAYNFAKSKGYKFKHHNLVWGSQYPAWITSLSPVDQKAQVDEWMQAVAARYPGVDFIDVVNEPIKTPCPFSEALGGSGATGWDWVVWAFQRSRELFPNAKLLINEYGTENDPAARSQYKTIINILKSKGLIDGIGVQSHYFNLDYMTANQMTTCLDDYATTGLPVYISELDITGGGVEATQASKYQELFPVMWNHPNVKGITLWGYIEGQTWATGSGIVNANGTERAAMSWLKTFMTTAKSFPDDGAIVAAIEEPVADRNAEFNFYPNPTSTGKLTIELPAGTTGLNILDYSGKSLKTWTVGGQQKLEIELNITPGIYLLHILGPAQKFKKLSVQ